MFVKGAAANYFEQLGALEHEGAIDFSLVHLRAGGAIVDRWELWEPAVRSLPQHRPYPMFEELASKLRATWEEARSAGRTLGTVVGPPSSVR